MSDTQWQIIVYDIRDIKRLRKVHGLLKRCAFSLQASVFAWHGTPRQLQRLKSELALAIDPKADDVRGYPLLAEHNIVWWGKMPLPAGLHIEGFPTLEQRGFFGQDAP
ncbi:CRISPR-associated endonuclease Cas2 [Halomonas sp. GFAJ-1]|uniref:CRISPR-associated endonuclease Cas2 n=1 Tax=Halomonas sp. GFAJ-1 TaxID=1118153 RepID=UPI00023A33CB|nr:CRISPR-associated endonuclease Cas2 [Halomonas sp. GFAJ-1]AVI62980.1 CRISPR-associated endonuclease Cas2 [Halomonas sp. GFAJ-1]EHK60287.1 CRISPR associated protein Cas2 [Halomonas sp. GFAJ-1]